MTDYFDTAFYVHLNVGKFGKDYEVVKMRNVVMGSLLMNVLGCFLIVAGIIAIAGSVVLW